MFQRDQHYHNPTRPYGPKDRFFADGDGDDGTPTSLPRSGVARDRPHGRVRTSRRLLRVRRREEVGHRLARSVSADPGRSARVHGARNRLRGRGGGLPAIQLRDVTRAAGRGSRATRCVGAHTQGAGLGTGGQTRVMCCAVEADICGVAGLRRRSYRRPRRHGYCTTRSVAEECAAHLPERGV